MARPQLVEDEKLMTRLSSVFRDVGYSGASLAALAEASGLKKASLYHRFPRGKQQMAEEVLSVALAWFGDHVIAPLEGPGSPAERLAAVARQLDLFYANGRQACLLNMLASPQADAGPFSEAIRGAFQALLAAFSKLALDAGLPPERAGSTAERVVIMLQGSLVVSRGLGTAAPFKSFLAGLPGEFGLDQPGSG